jgi:hypothetical protein
MHFVYGFCDGNSLTVLTEYQRQYQDMGQPFINVLQMGQCNLTRRHSLSCVKHILAMEDT